MRNSHPNKQTKPDEDTQPMLIRPTTHNKHVGFLPEGSSPRAPASLHSDDESYEPPMNAPRGTKAARDSAMRVHSDIAKFKSTKEEFMSDTGNGNNVDRPRVLTAVSFLHRFSDPVEMDVELSVGGEYILNITSKQFSQKTTCCVLRR